ncbi:hypothetical protein ACIO14_00525 [Nocardia fluminea]|uniref:hypothetical protein n=1 Tax=Nocardia fluminea TaxID=134984 RepID=UPI00380C67DB
MAIIGGALISVSSCTNQGISVVQPRFDQVPSSCAVALTPARTEIDYFSDGLRAEGERINPDPDPDLGQRSKGVRCASIFTRFDTWVPFDETALRPTKSSPVRLVHTCQPTWQMTRTRSRPPSPPTSTQS